MRVGVSTGCSLPSVLLPGRYPVLVERLLKTDGVDFLAGLAMKPAMKHDMLFEHYEGPWNHIVKSPSKQVVYSEKPDRIHRLVFPSAPKAFRWCCCQQAGGGMTSGHFLPGDLVLANNETIELHPGQGMIGKTNAERLRSEDEYIRSGLPKLLNVYGRDLADRNGNRKCFTYDTWHGIRDGWDLDSGHLLESFGRWVNDVHFQPPRNDPKMLPDLWDGKETRAINMIRTLRDECGFDGDITVEISPLDNLKPLLGLPGLFKANLVLEAIVKTVEAVRVQLKID